jgi:hypothetical protein
VSDVFIFIMGCFVSLAVASAVGLLMWGAANEQRGELLTSQKLAEPKPEALTTPRTEGQPTSSGLASKSPA